MAIRAQNQQVGRLIGQFVVDARLTNRDDVVNVPGRCPARLAELPAFCEDLPQHRLIPPRVRRVSHALRHPPRRDEDDAEEREGANQNHFRHRKTPTTD